jgi:hypothetical protein
MGSGPLYGRRFVGKGVLAQAQSKESDAAAGQVVLGHCPDSFLHSKLRESANPPDSHPTRIMAQLGPTGGVPKVANMGWAGGTAAQRAFVKVGPRRDSPPSPCPAFSPGTPSATGLGRRRLDQANAAAATLGPAIAGGLVGVTPETQRPSRASGEGRSFVCVEPDRAWLPISRLLQRRCLRGR